MNENIDLTIILKGCPKGTKFYSSVYGEVSFERIDISDDEYPIIVRFYNKRMTSMPAFITKDGQASSVFNGECILFPSKYQRDWSKFERFWDISKAEKPMAEIFDENTLKPFDKVLVRNLICDCWNAVTFSHINFKRQAICCGISWEQCVPYNEETKYLVNTNEDCPEYYKWWKI